MCISLDFSVCCSLSKEGNSTRLQESWLILIFSWHHPREDIRTSYQKDESSSVPLGLFRQGCRWRRRRQWQPTPVFLPGKSHGWRSLVGCSPWGSEESDTTEQLAFHFSPSCIGEGNGSPLQCSCLENPRDGGAWWTAVYGVAQSRTRLKRLSSSSSSRWSQSIFCGVLTYWKVYFLKVFFIFERLPVSLCFE